MLNTTESAVQGKESFALEMLPLKKAAAVLRAVNHKLRQDLLRLLHRKGPTSVTDIYRSLHLEQSVASQHLSILRRSGLVRTERRGKQIFYSVNYDRMEDIVLHAKALLN